MMIKQLKERNMMKFDVSVKLSELDEWIVDVDSVVNESGVWRFVLDDDMNIIEGVKVDSIDEEVRKYIDDELRYEFWCGEESDYEYWCVEV